MIVRHLLYYHRIRFPYFPTPTPPMPSYTTTETHRQPGPHATNQPCATILPQPSTMEPTHKTHCLRPASVSPTAPYAPTMAKKGPPMKKVNLHIHDGNKLRNHNDMTGDPNPNAPGMPISIRAQRHPNKMYHRAFFTCLDMNKCLTNEKAPIVKHFCDALEYPVPEEILQFISDNNITPLPDAGSDTITSFTKIFGSAKQAARYAQAWNRKEENKSLNFQQICTILNNAMLEFRDNEDRRKNEKLRNKQDRTTTKDAVKSAEHSTTPQPANNDQFPPQRTEQRSDKTNGHHAAADIQKHQTQTLFVHTPTKRPHDTFHNDPYAEVAQPPPYRKNQPAYSFPITSTLTPFEPAKQPYQPDFRNPTMNSEQLFRLAAIAHQRETALAHSRPYGNNYNFPSPLPFKQQSMSTHQRHPMPLSASIDDDNDSTSSRTSQF